MSVAANFEDETSDACVDRHSVAELTAVNDDGRIDIDVGSGLGRRLSKLLAGSGPSGESYEGEGIAAVAPTGVARPRLNIVIQVAGSRGDVQPFVALGCELQRQHGHRVRIATHATFEDFVREAGLEFYPIGADPAELMAYIVKNPGLIPSMGSIKSGDVKRKRESISEMLQGCWESCINPDHRTGAPFVAEVIIANPPSFAHIHCAQALAIPVHIMFTMPWTSTRSFPHPLANLRGFSSEDRGIANFISYAVVEWITWQGIGGLINQWRRGTLGLEPVPPSAGPMLVEKLAIPHTYCWSPAFVPKPSDWPVHIDVCGFFFREPITYEPPEDLASFLEAGSTPIYIGFGSIVLEDAKTLTEVIMRAVDRAQVRAIISRGWSRLGEGVEPPENVFWLEDCPHEWLFQHVSAVIHHGGAGTTACGLLNGRPTAIVPFFGDQPFWGHMIAAAGAGPSPIPHRFLSHDKLAEAIEFCLLPTTAQAARSISAKMRAESGVEAAVDSFHRHLPEALECDLLPGQAAAWTYVRGKMRSKLSKRAAAILCDAKKIETRHLKALSARPFVIDSRRWDPVTAILSASLETVTAFGETASETFTGVRRAIQLQGSRSTPNLRTDAVSSSTLTKERISSDENVAGASDTLSNRDIMNFGSVSVGPRGADGLPTSADDRCSLTSSTSSQDRRPKDVRNGARAAATTPAKSLGRLLATPVKGIMVDLPLAATEGMRAVPERVGRSRCRDYGLVTDWKSGTIVAAKSFGYGIYEGGTDIFIKTFKRKQQEGAKGVAKGLAEGLVDFTMKTGSGVVGLVAYPNLGIYRSLYAALHRDRSVQVSEAMQQEGEWLLAQDGKAAKIRSIVTVSFDALRPK